MSKHYVWVHTLEVDCEGSSLAGVYMTLGRAKSILGGKWTKLEPGVYVANITRYYDYDKIEKIEVK
jgi:hypothetical protein